MLAARGGKGVFYEFIHSKYIIYIARFRNLITFVTSWCTRFHSTGYLFLVFCLFIHPLIFSSKLSTAQFCSPNDVF